MKQYTTAAELRAWQKARSLTNVEMCKLLAVGLCTYSRWRNAKQSTPRWLPYRLEDLTAQQERVKNAAFRR